MIWLIIFWSFFFTTPAHGIGLDIVYDPTACGHLIEQIEAMGKQLTTMQDQAKSLQQEIKQLTSSQYKWGSAENVINNAVTILNQTKSVVYTANNVDDEFRQIFHGYKPPTNFADEYGKMVSNLDETLNGTLKVLNVASKDFNDSKNRISTLQQQVQGAQGTTQAIQAVSQFVAEEVTQIQKLQQVIMTQTNAQVAYYATQTQKEANTVANVNQVIANGNKDVTGTLDGHPLNMKQK